MWFFYSLLTITAWGSGNVFQKAGTNPKDKTSHWKIVIMIGFVMGIHAIGYMIMNQYHFDFFNIIKYFPVSFLYIASMTFSYVGLRYLDLSILSPVCNSSGAVAALLCFLFLDQSMSLLQLFAIAMVCVGIVLLSYFEKKAESADLPTFDKTVNKKYMYGAMALVFPLLYCGLDGVGTFADAIYLNYYMTEEEALLSYEFTFLISAILAFIYVKFIKKTTFFFHEEKWKAISGVCEAAGQFTYVYAMADNAILAAPLIASYCVMSVVLSRIFLKEKLAPKQYLAIAIVVFGIVILGME